MTWMLPLWLKIVAAGAFMLLVVVGLFLLAEGWERADARLRRAKSGRRDD